MRYSLLSRVNARLPGTSRSKPSNTARGTPSDLADLRLAAPKLVKSEGGQNGLRQASMSRGVEARGSVRTLGVPRALGSFESGGWTTAYPAPVKNTGDDACLEFTRRKLRLSSPGLARGSRLGRHSASLSEMA